jgi:uncharacterized membrane protein
MSPGDAAASCSDGHAGWGRWGRSQERPRGETSVSTMEDPSALFQILLLLHIAAAIVGFGGVITHGAYNARAFQSSGTDAVPVLEATKKVTNIAHYGIYATLVFGVLLISVSSGDIGWGEAWISSAFVLWILIVGVAHGLVRPAVAALTDRATEVGGALMADDSEAMALAKKLALGEGLTQVLLAVALVAMVWQFGA